MRSRSFVFAVTTAAAGAMALIVNACSSSGSGAASSIASSMPMPSGVATTISGDISTSNAPTMRYPESAKAPSPDPRIGLKPGANIGEAGEAAWNVRFISNSAPTEGFSGRGATGSDLAFKGNLVIQGNYRGFQIWDIANPRSPKFVVGFLCPSAQGDPSVFGNLVFISGEAGGARNDCGTTNITDTVSMERFRGVRIVDISNPGQPKVVKNVQTCRGSHTHTLLTDPKDKDNIYVYVSGYSSVRSATELAGCKQTDGPDSTSAQFRIEVIKVPLAHPEQATVVNSPHLLADLQGRVRHVDPPDPPEFARPGRGGGGGAGGRGGRAGGAGGDSTAAGRGGRAGAGAGDTTAAAGGRGGRGGRGGGRGGPQIGQSGCHDITTYPAIGMAGGACSGYGLLFDIRTAGNPKRLLSVADSNMSFWHSATFSNDGTKLLFSDEWGGGSQPKCRSIDRMEWGGNALFTLENGQLHFKSYYKMPAAQAIDETCTAHNGSLIPVPGRDIMVQAFYQGGFTIFDWTDVSHPIEIGFFDRGPGGGYWSTYWYNGLIISNDETRGLDIHELTPGPYLSQNEIDAAKTVKLAQFNAQEQVRFVWPPSYALARSYLDQLERNNGLAAVNIGAIRSVLATAERAGDKAALANLATRIQGDVASASDKGRVQLLQMAVRDLSKK